MATAIDTQNLVLEHFRSWHVDQPSGQRTRVAERLAIENGRITRIVATICAVGGG